MNENEKVDELSKKAEQGDVEAQVELGDMYYFGEYAEQDYKKAFEWYTKAAEQGYGDDEHPDREVRYRGASRNPPGL